LTGKLSSFGEEVEEYDDMHSLITNHVTNGWNDFYRTNGIREEKNR
jgi:hypothetical protein